MNKFGHKTLNFNHTILLPPLSAGLGGWGVWGCMGSGGSCLPLMHMITVFLWQLAWHFTGLKRTHPDTLKAPNGNCHLTSILVYLQCFPSI